MADSAKKAPPSWAERTSTAPSPAKPGHQHHHPRRQTTDDANLPAFFHVKGTDGSAGYTGASPDDTQVLTMQDEPAQWTKLWGEDAEGIQMDRVSLFSVTPARQADEMTKILLSLPGISSESTITDGTACVGGNTVSFARFFAHVNAVEMDAKRCDMLINNVEVCRKHARAKGGDFPAFVKFFSENSLDLIPRLRQDIVFLDPPWGGKDYKSKTTVPLFLSSKPIHEVVIYCLRHTKYVALKLPKNAELMQLISDARLEVIVTKEFPSFLLLVVSSLLKPKKLYTDVETLSPSDSRLESLLTNLVKTKPFQDIMRSTVLGTTKQQPGT